MAARKHIEVVCWVVVALTLAVTVIFLNGQSLGLEAAAASLGYEERLFDTGTVHAIDIAMDDWEGFLEGCTDEEYVLCSLTIDGETYANVAIRAKGNTSLTQVASYGNDRYSFKVEFDHYDSGMTYHGLDKLCLNNIIQDNTYMKDYLTYQMMDFFGADAPLSSFVYLTVNGEDWGLYLAVEGVEESFLERNYGSSYGELYKPDSQSMGGGRGNGADFDMEDWQQLREDLEEQTPDLENVAPPEDFAPQEFAADQSAEDMAGSMGGGRGGMGGGMGTMGSSDVSLLYTDDDYDSYSNIFDNAKTDPSDADKDRLIAALKDLNEGVDIEDTVDVDEVIRYFVVHNFVCNFDSYTGSMIHNYYLYEEDGQLSMIPWDYNLAFGGFQGAQDATALVNYPIDTPVSGGTVESRPMLAWIFASEEYTALYHQYFAEFIETYFDSGYFTRMMEETYELIAPYVEKDPTKFCTYEEFEEGFAALEQFCLLRAESVSGQLAGTIPSTDEGQSQDSSALVDASGLEISAMGSMNAGGMGGGMGRPGGGWDFPQGDETAEAGQGSDASANERPGGFPAFDRGGGEGTEEVAGEESGSLPTFHQAVMPSEELSAGGNSGDWNRWQAGAVPGQETSPDGETWLILGLSAAVLAGGLLTIWRYKKRG